MMNKEQAMKGSIRVVLGMLIVFGAVGTMDVDPEANLVVQTALAVVGLIIAFSGVRAMRQSEYE
jgi:hypothetical protein